MTTDPRPWYFVSVVWGPLYRTLFMDCLMSSLLADGNLPALTAFPHKYLLLCTTPEDYLWIEQHPLWLDVQRYVQPMFMPVEPGTGHTTNCKAMSKGHLAASKFIYEQGGLATYLCPDAIWSNGSLRYLQAQALQQVPCVLATAVRHSLEGVVDALSMDGYLYTGQPLTIEAGALARIGCAHLHPETKTYNWEERFFSYVPVCVYWPMPQDGGLVMFSQSWGPVLLDYRFIQMHDTHALETWTMDGNYIYANLQPEQVVAVHDSDDVLVVSLTKEATLIPRRRTNKAKASSVRCVAYSSIMDPLKQRLLRRPVRWHVQALNADWREREVAYTVYFLALLGTARRWYDDLWRRWQMVRMRERLPIWYLLYIRSLWAGRPSNEDCQAWLQNE